MYGSLYGIYGSVKVGRCLRTNPYSPPIANIN